jgi:hypothetical protein
MSEQVIKKIVAALKNKLAELVIADHMDVLNALTELIITTLKNSEYLSAPQAYRRAAEVFADAAFAEEAEAAETAAEEAAKAAAEAKRRPARRISTQTKSAEFLIRQRRVAQRAAKRGVRS